MLPNNIFQLNQADMQNQIYAVLFRLLVLDSDESVGLLQMSASFQKQNHRLTLLIDPDHDGLVKAVLASRCLHILGPCHRER